MRRQFPSVVRLSHAGVMVPTLQQRFHFIRGNKQHELIHLLEAAARDEWLAGGSTMVFCRGARTAQAAHARRTSHARSA